MNVFTRRIFFNMLRNPRSISIVSSRPMKNFGHKREYVPFVTTLWHGSLTFAFLGLLMNWERIKMFLFGDTLENMVQESIESNDKI